MIYVYPQTPSVLPGEILTLRVSTDAPQFKLDFYRFGEQIIPLGDLGYGWQKGTSCGFHRPWEDWGTDSVDDNNQIVPAWPSHNILIPDNWQSAVYIVVCTEGDEQGQQISFPDVNILDAESYKALFVIKNPFPGAGPSILYKLPLFTYHAYNELGDPLMCFYTGAPVASLRRPGGGIGGRPWDSYATNNYPAHTDVYDEWVPGQSGSRRQTFAHWDAKFIQWMERNGYSADFCTDLDLHENSSALLNAYGLLVSVGHDEYWSQPMRDNVENFIRQGGNVAFFSGNTCYKQIEFEDASHTTYHISAFWWQLNDPENTVIGVGYRNGGGQWDGPRPGGLGYTIQNEHSWFLRFTNLTDGMTLGDYYNGNADDPAAIVGYECDGAYVDRNLLGNAPLVPLGTDGSPSNFTILGWSDVRGWQDFYYPSGVPGNQVATMGFYINNGTVFNAATSDWARVLDSGKASVVERITSNVLNGLSRLPQVAAPVSIAGFFSEDDGFSHAIVVSNDGILRECFYSLAQGKGLALLSNLPGTVSVGGFYSGDDNYRHGIAVDGHGDITEVFYNPLQGQGQVILANIPNTIAVSAFFSSDDNFRHVITAAKDGNVTEIFYNPQEGQGQVVLTNIPDLVSVSGFFSRDDNFRHAIGGSSDGSVTEVFYNPQQGQGQVVLSNIPGLVSLSGFFSSDDNFRHVIVLTKDGQVNEIFYHPQFGQGQVVLATIEGAISVSGFFSSDDNFRRVIIATQSGIIKEIFYHPNQGVYIR